MQTEVKHDISFQCEHILQDSQSPKNTHLLYVCLFDGV